MDLIFDLYYSTQPDEEDMMNETQSKSSVKYN
jgi:hypothetical protein